MIHPQKSRKNYIPFSIVSARILRYNPSVRLDLFLKLTRLVKRRSLARELCEQGRAQVNGQSAKPAKEVKPGDRIRISYSFRTIEFNVLALPTTTRKVQPEPCFIVTEDIRTPATD